jgi:thiol:disulfide interchange protein
MKADWTNRDEQITRALAEFGRNGVPLYVLYDRAGKPTVLPELLTETTVLAALEKLN